jgi:Domain of unknown function (DUF6398)
VSKEDWVAVIALDELKIPKGLRPVVDEIAGITDSVCLSVLDEEYADLARRAVAKLARKRPSPLHAGRRATWAAGVVYALGQINFLSDPASEPCVTADQLSAAFRRLAGADTARASQLFQHLLNKPSFSWERDGEALLRKHKPWCFGAEPQPPVTLLRSELAKALPSSS